MHITAHGWMQAFWNERIASGRQPAATLTMHTMLYYSIGSTKHTALGNLLSRYLARSHPTLAASEHDSALSWEVVSDNPSVSRQYVVPPGRPHTVEPAKEAHSTAPVEGLVRTGTFTPGTHCHPSSRRMSSTVQWNTQKQHQGVSPCALQLWGGATTVLYCSNVCHGALHFGASK